MHKRFLSVYGPRENWGEGTNKTDRKGDERVFCLNFCVPKMWEHLLRGLGARERGERGKRGEGSVFTSRSFILTEVVSVTRPDAGA